MISEEEKTCKLEDGNIHYYDLASENINAYQDIAHSLRYVGRGVCYFRTGVPQFGSDKLHFWVRDKGTPTQEENDLGMTTLCVILVASALTDT